MAFCQQEPIVPGMLNQSPAGLDHALLQAGQGPVAYSLGQRQPPPQVAQVVSQDAQLQPHLVGAEAMTANTTESRKSLHS